mmetsp:Transcript_9589/g.32125  ORF Transcript_9589/g.32125 Transcript_9589/m.32125 type:complete len:220 (-) Transcript_9589:1202-1861(-)
MVDDVCRAIAWTKTFIMQRSKEQTPLILMGHSAGAHLCAMAVVRRALSEAGLRAEEGSFLGWSCSDLSALVGLSGVYHISDHFEHEATRGVSEVSPMCGRKKNLFTTAGLADPVMGADRSLWDNNSPSKLVEDLRGEEGLRLSRCLPPVLLLHGTDDVVVPVSSSFRFFSALKRIQHSSCKLRYLAGCDHGLGIYEDTGGASKFWAEVIAQDVLMASKR